MHIKTRYIYRDRPKEKLNLTKKGQNWRTNITDRKIGFPCLHFTIKVFTDLCCFSSMSDYFTFSMWDCKGQWHQIAQKISLILFFSKYVTGTFLDDHHVVRNVLDIMFIITFQNSKFRSFSIHRYFLFTLVQVFFWLWQMFTKGLESPSSYSKRGKGGWG